MPIFCVVPGCDNRVREKQTEGGMSFHRFPKLNRLELCKQWLRAIQHPRYDESITDPAVLGPLRVCSEHFTADDFQRNLMAELMDIKAPGETRKTKALLRENAVPSIFPHKTGDTEAEASTSAADLDLMAKRSRTEEPPMPEPTRAAYVPAGAYVAGETDEERHRRLARERQQRCRQKLPEDVDTEEYHWKSERQRRLGRERQQRYRQRLTEDVDDEQHQLELQPEPVPAVPEGETFEERRRRLDRERQRRRRQNLTEEAAAHQRRLTRERRRLKRQQQRQGFGQQGHTGAPEPARLMGILDTSSSSGEAFNSKDSNYFPEDYSITSATPMIDWPKAILYESCIRELFRKCQCCGKPITDTHVTYVGSQMRVSWECLGGHSGTWTSTPEVRGMPEMSNSDSCVSSLSSAAPWRTDGCMAPIFTLEDKNTETEAGLLSLPAPEEEERNSSLVQMTPELIQIKEEPEEEPLQGPEEAAESTVLEVKIEDDDDEHMKTQAYINYWLPSSQPASDDQVHSSNCSESDITEEDGDDWEKTMANQSILNKLNLHETENMEERRLSLRKKLDSSSQQTPPTSSQTENKDYSCKDCGKVFSGMGYLKRHMNKRHVNTHSSSSKPLPSTANSKGFNFKFHSETPFVCTICEKHFSKNRNLEKHMNQVHPPEVIQGN